ncbi:MAG: DUF2079 domain-containing protein [Lentisphaerota bacterium]
MTWTCETFKKNLEGRFVRRGLAALAAAGFLTAAAALLRAAFCAFSAFKFTLIDYGGYLNMLWNTGHGRPFRMLMEFSYLRFHLSFTLALLGPLFRIWDHPFLLSFLQWLMAVGGALVLGFSAPARKLPADLRWVLILFFLANPFMQSVLLSEFHGVAFYAVLFPWLYISLERRRLSAWIPLLLIAGLREDAAFLVIPMILYFAVRSRWRAGYLMAGFALCYGLFACTWLFQWINEVPLTAQRSGLKGSALLRQWLSTPWRLRLAPWFWMFLPALPFLRRRGWLPLLLFPSAGLLINSLSPQAPQFTFGVHYSAPVIVLFCIALLHVLSEKVCARACQPTAAALYLCCVLAVAHVFRGFLPGGGQRLPLYARPDPQGLETLAVAQSLPREGLLLCNWKTAGMCANRADLITWKYPDLTKYSPDLILLVRTDMTGEEKRGIRSFLQSPEYGVIYSDARHLVLSKGASPARNGEMLKQSQPGGVVE